MREVLTITKTQVIAVELPMGATQDIMGKTGDGSLVLDVVIGQMGKEFGPEQITFRVEWKP